MTTTTVNVLIDPPRDKDRPFRGKRVHMDGEVLVFGRDGRKCDVTFNEKSVSRTHLEIRRDGDKLLARDLHSQTGVRVTGVELAPGGTARLKHNDDIVIAHGDGRKAHRLRVEITDPDETATSRRKRRHVDPELLRTARALVNTEPPRHRTTAELRERLAIGDSSVRERLGKLRDHFGLDSSLSHENLRVALYEEILATGLLNEAEN